ncbi:PepSY domain-containing protein [Aliikangiella sp. G2MR2-5]|uniref:PepSY domain-containing protein n=1 Tax=Aliikangiella sp. G2MR2-5 TaxID=2788943 RepID=UPI0018ABAAFF|nr:PepSY domain-containing protein [Aliikangiella sp. G2MR2-5]
MNAYQKKQKQKKRKSIFRKWHRRMGFAASLFILNLAVTGILLNHYEQLGLHKSFVSSSWLLDLYGVKAPEDVRCYQQTSFTACQLGRQIFINQSYWQESEDMLLGLIQTGDSLYLLTESERFILSPKLQLIDQELIAESIGQNIDAVYWPLNQDNNEPLIVRSANDFFRFDLEQEEWESMQKPQEIQEQPTFSPGSESVELLQSLYRENQITHLRFVQDLHSGRVIGLSGQTTNDLSAFILILLAISGFITWQRRKNRPTS